MSAQDSLAPFNPVPITGARVAAPIRDVSLTIGVAVGSIAFAPLLHVTSPILAIGVETLIACAIAVAAPAYAPAIAIFILFFQNLFVSILSPYIADPSQVEFIKGYNFLSCSVMWLTTLGLYGLRWKDYPVEVHRLMAWGMFVLGMVGVYFLIGFGQDPVAASVYLRNIVLPLFLFQLSLLTAATYEVRVTPFFVTIAVILILCGYIEFAFRDFWLDITNGQAFWRFDEIKATNSGIWEKEMRTTGNVFVDLKDRFKFGFLNTPLLDGLGLSEILRIFGPNMSPISFGYGVAFFGLFLFSVGYPLLALAALPLVVFCSVKGALILILFVSMAAQRGRAAECLLWRSTPFSESIPACRSRTTMSSALWGAGTVSFKGRSAAVWASAEICQKVMPRSTGAPRSRPEPSMARSRAQWACCSIRWASQP